ncbi:MAG: VOC family protein [Alphaproteobacteria bacterium]|nr:VOC family protein [Alphaproteobacteria bacterium]
MSIGVADIVRSRDFYDRVFAVLGYQRLYDIDGEAAAYGPEMPSMQFWITRPLDGDRPTAPCNGMHVCFQAKSRDLVRAFHDAAIAAGGTDAGAPGLRPEYSETYYGAFVFDPDGHKIEAVCYDAE